MKKYLHILNQQYGFTLLEVVVAMSILVIGILGTSSLLYRVTGNNTRGNLTTQANLLAASKMEELKHKTTLTLLDTFNGGNDTVNSLGTGGGVTNFTRTWTITNPVGNSRLITVTVVAQSGMGQRTIVLRSLTQGTGI